ncbi:MAG: hypothetical protein AB4038_03870 [Prochloraceae cyanobacterium]
MDIETLDRTFLLLKLNSTRLSSMLWLNLMSYPEIRWMLSSNDLLEKERETIRFLKGIFANIYQVNSLKNQLRTWLEKYELYEVIYRYHQIIREIFLKTLESYLGDAWTSEVKLAWTDLYNLIISLSLEIEQEKANHTALNCLIKKLKYQAIAQKLNGTII